RSNLPASIAIDAGRIDEVIASDVLGHAFLEIRHGFKPPVTGGTSANSTHREKPRLVECTGRFVQTDGMFPLASFNYDPPSATAIALGVVLGLLTILLAAWSRRVLIGVFATSLGWAVIAGFVCFQGRGDLTIIMVLFFGGASGIAGAIAGG